MTIKTLYTNGCSWTFGAEIEQDTVFTDYLGDLGMFLQDPSDDLNWNIVDKDGNIVSRLDYHYDNFNWPGQLKKKLGAKTLINHALGGGSNSRILRTTLEYVMSLPPEERGTTLIVIGWTVSERDEIYVKKSWERWNLAQKFSATVDRLKVSDQDFIDFVDKFQDDYMGLVYDDYANLLKYFNDTYLLSNTLKNLGIKHLFFNALPAWWEAGELKTDCDPIIELPVQLNLHETNNNILSFRDNMMGFVTRENCTVGKYLHPLVNAHQLWGTHLLQQLRQRNII
jgi:hypothetical protein